MKPSRCCYANVIQQFYKTECVLRRRKQLLRAPAGASTSAVVVSTHVSIFILLNPLFAVLSCLAAPSLWIGRFRRAQVAVGLRRAGASEFLRLLHANSFVVSKKIQFFEPQYSCFSCAQGRCTPLSTPQQRAMAITF